MELLSEKETAVRNAKLISHYALGFSKAIDMEIVGPNKNRLLLELDGIEELCKEIRNFIIKQGG